MTRVWRVAVPGPLRTLLDYLPPADGEAGIGPGSRVLVPLGRRQVVGIAVEAADSTALEETRLRAIQRVPEPATGLSQDLLRLGLWAANYYLHPPGEVLTHMLPAALRRVTAPRGPREQGWRLTRSGRSAHTAQLEGRPAQAHALAVLAAAARPLTADEVAAAGCTAHGLRALQQAGLAERCALDASSEPAATPGTVGAPGPDLNPDQREAVDRIVDALGSHRTLLLDGITGSGKTEVYFNAISAALQRGRQALLLVPEISLTPQMVRRVRDRFDVPLAVSHSGLSDSQRLQAWQAAADGTAKIVIGTRSGVFTPLPEPGLIIVDEEHDESFKQQDGLRYSARDLAVKRAFDLGCPVVLGSATPSLESLHNAAEGRYLHLHLPTRAGPAVTPRYRVIDLRRQTLEEGISAPVLEALGETLARGEQGLVFLNRRGYAPVMMCHDCGWIAECRRCDARLTLHARPVGLRCHHCGVATPAPSRCPGCGAPEPMPVGLGTQRTEAVLARHFPTVPVLRIDRDSTRSMRALDATLEQVRSAGPALLVGTRMLAKGHHFPQVTRVAILDADAGLFSADFRAPERTAQLLMQVSGRAGRGSVRGEVLIQTHHPDNALLAALLEDGYGAFARGALEERAAAALPPFSHQAVIRAEAVDAALPMRFLEQAADLLGAAARGVEVLGPLPCLMERRGGRHRAQLLLQAVRRRDLHATLATTLPALDGLADARRVRWHLEVDPLEAV